MTRTEYRPLTEEEKKFIEEYDSSIYDKPSVTADVVIMTLIPGKGLGVVLVQRKEFPYMNSWAVPGGFVGISEDIEETARRTLKEKAGISDAPFYQFHTFGAVKRDPRMRVISVSYMAFVPMERLSFSAKGTSDDSGIFLIKRTEEGMTFTRDEITVKEDDLAFDHAEIISTAMKHLRSRLDYTDDALAFVDPKCFTVSQIRDIFEAVKGEKEDPGNFRRYFVNRYEKTGIVEDTGEVTSGDVGRPSVIYRITKK